MLIDLSKLNNLPVGSFEAEEKVGKVLRPLLNPDEGRVIGFAVLTRELLPKLKVLSIQDVVDIDRNGLVIRSADSLVDSKEIVRIAEILKKKFDLIGLKTYFKSGEKLGKVSDAVIESQTGDVTRIYVGSLFKSFAFEKSKIFEITWTKVLIKDEKNQKSKVRPRVVPSELPEPA